MHFALSMVAVFSALVVTNAQYPQYPPQFVDNPAQQSFAPFNPYRGGYQLRGPPPPRFNPFENVYSPKGEKLTCRMVCAPVDNDDIDDAATAAVPEKKDSNENKIEKKE